MEPYRPYVDKLVIDLVDNGINITSITKEIKQSLLTVPVLDVVISGQRSPLMIAVGQTTASVYRCFAGESRKIVYPEI